MPIFKYTVANPEGKKLSGTVEAVSEQTARGELNNLGFSILALELAPEIPKIDSKLTRFIFEAIDKSGQVISGTIPAENENSALDRLVREYSLNVRAIWPEGADDNTIEQARQKRLAELSSSETAIDQSGATSKEEIIKQNVEFVLKKIYDLLKTFEKDIDLDQRAEIEKRIEKLLRIKGSTNTDYVLATVKDVLHFIESQEKILQQKGLIDQRIALKMQTKELLSDLNRSSEDKLFSNRIVKYIDHWEKRHQNPNIFLQIIQKFFTLVRNFLSATPEIIRSKEQIRTYNRQLIEFIQLYFKEPTKEYKQKVWQSVGAIWKARKTEKKRLHTLIATNRLTEKKEQAEKESIDIPTFLDEIGSFSGWLLGFYLIYYFVSLYLSSKDFGLSNIPAEFFVYDTHIFKYALVIIFLLHISIAIKTNFFRKSFLANLILLPAFLIFLVAFSLNF